MGVGMVVTSGKPMWCNGSTLAQNARDVGLTPTRGTTFPIFITLATLLILSVSLGIDSFVSHRLDSVVIQTPATSTVISGWIPNCDSAHTWYIYSAVPLGDQVS